MIIYFVFPCIFFNIWLHIEYNWLGLFAEQGSRELPWLLGRNLTSSPRSWSFSGCLCATWLLRKYQNFHVALLAQVEAGILFVAHQRQARKAPFHFPHHCHWTGYRLATPGSIVLWNESPNPFCRAWTILFIVERVSVTLFSHYGPSWSRNKQVVMIHLCNELEAVMYHVSFWHDCVSCIQIVQRKQSYSSHGTAQAASSCELHEC